MNAKVKKILSVLSSIIIILVVVLALVVSITSMTAKANGGVPDLFGYTTFSIQTDSMNPTIKSGDYIFGTKCDPETLKVGDIITYFTLIDNQKAINTHRIVEIVENGSITCFRTQGDNKLTNAEPDELLVDYGDVISKYNGTRIPFMGSAIDFLGTKLGFFLFLVLPVLIYTLYQVYKLVAVVMHNQKAKLAETEDEIKRAAIAEYLVAQNKEKENTKAEEKAEEVKEETDEDGKE